MIYWQQNFQCPSVCTHTSNMTEETVLEKRQNNDQRQFTKDTQKTKTKTQLMVIK